MYGLNEGFCGTEGGVKAANVRKTKPADYPAVDHALFRLNILCDHSFSKMLTRIRSIAHFLYRIGVFIERFCVTAT